MQRIIIPDGGNLSRGTRALSTIGSFNLTRGMFLVFYSAFVEIRLRFCCESLCFIPRQTELVADSRLVFATLPLHNGVFRSCFVFRCFGSNISQRDVPSKPLIFSYVSKNHQIWKGWSSFCKMPYLQNDFRVGGHAEVQSGWWIWKLQKLA